MGIDFKTLNAAAQEKVNSFRTSSPGVARLSDKALRFVNNHPYACLAGVIAASLLGVEAGVVAIGVGVADTKLFGGRGRNAAVNMTTAATAAVRDTEDFQNIVSHP